MPIVTPNIFTSHHLEEVQALTSANEEALKKVIYNINYLIGFQPIGKLMFYSFGQDGLPAIDETVWQLCDGTEITNPNSPLRTIGVSTRFTPNLLTSNKYLRGAPDQRNTDTGGSNTFSFPHNHGGGLTGTDFPSGEFLYEADGDITFDPNQFDGRRRVRVAHGHAIFEHPADVIEVDYPEWKKMMMYMKVA